MNLPSHSLLILPIEVLSLILIDPILTLSEVLVPSHMSPNPVPENTLPVLRYRHTRSRGSTMAYIGLKDFYPVIITRMSCLRSDDSIGTARIAR